MHNVIIIIIIIFFFNKKSTIYVLGDRIIVCEILEK